MVTYTSDELGKFVIENSSLLQECHRLRDESAQLISLSRALCKESDLLRRQWILTITQLKNWGDRESQNSGNQETENRESGKPES
jgi:hypothetical protein